MRKRLKVRASKDTWPHITTYHSYIGEAIGHSSRSDDIPVRIKNEGHVWWLITRTEDEWNALINGAPDEWVETGAYYILPDLGRILRQVFSSKYQGFKEYQKQTNPAPPINRRFLLRVFSGESLPRALALTKWVRYLGYDDLFDAIRTALNETTSKLKESAPF